MRHCTGGETPGRGEGLGRHSQLFKRGNEVQLGWNEPRWLTNLALCLAVSSSETLHVLGFLQQACSYSLSRLKWPVTVWQTKRRQMWGGSLKFPTPYLSNPAASPTFIRWFKRWKINNLHKARFLLLGIQRQPQVQLTFSGSKNRVNLHPSGSTAVRKRCVHTKPNYQMKGELDWLMS